MAGLPPEEQPDNLDVDSGAEAIDMDDIYEVIAIEHFYAHQRKETWLKAEYLADDLNGMTKHHQGEIILFDREIALDENNSAYWRDIPKSNISLGNGGVLDRFVVNYSYTDGSKYICAEISTDDGEKSAISLWNEDRQTLLWPRFEPKQTPKPKGATERILGFLARISTALTRERPDKGKGRF
ncbi:MAG: hypothetical protein WDZ42_00945 [Candidatus Saccharimonadales bacterium]